MFSSDLKVCIGFGTRICVDWGILVSVFEICNRMDMVGVKPGGEMRGRESVPASGLKVRLGKLHRFSASPDSRVFACLSCLASGFRVFAIIFSSYICGLSYYFGWLKSNI